jgi:alpha-glucosidase
LYFFGHGHDYKVALKEFTMLSGRIPLPPRYAFGVYYSRYWAYNDIGEMEIVDNYEQRGIPLDVLVTDMDWHITFYKEAREGKKDLAGQSIGWTGFTWDNHLFPEPKMFLDWCKSQGLHNTLNLHPASGIQPWEEKFVEMAQAMGITPSNNTYVPFKPTDKKFVTNWFKIVLGEREQEGIDFWWLDWQQGEDWIKVVGVNPTFWLNYIFFTNPYHWNGTAPKLTRPFLMHRWGGLGNHRYQIGFSGDVVPSWNSLKFQVYFTICATNVGFGYWSHDIGGFVRPSPPELFTRWIQWGAFSPIFKTHCNKNGDNFRRIWLYPPANYPIMRSFMRLRLALVPYIYTQAYSAYDTGLSILRGMYYDYPEDPEAYAFMDSQYMFGESLLVAPITEAIDNTTGMVEKKIWIPEGSYVSWISGEVVKGPQIVQRHFTLHEMPLFAKAGAIIPMRTDDFSPLGSAQEIPTSLKLMTFLGGIAMSGSGSLYEDDGNTVQYMMGKSSMQRFTLSTSNNVLTFTISETSNPSALGLTMRSYQICLFGSWPASVVSVDDTGAQYTPLRGPVYKPNTWTYDGSSLTTIITTDALDLSKQHTVKVTFTSAPVSTLLQSNFVGMTKRFVQVKQLLDDQWGIKTVFQEDYFALLNATEIGQRNSYLPARTEQNLKLFSAYSSNAITEVENLSNLEASVKQQILAMLQNP